MRNASTVLKPFPPCSEVGTVCPQMLWVHDGVVKYSTKVAKLPGRGLASDARHLHAAIGQAAHWLPFDAIAHNGQLLVSTDC